MRRRHRRALCDVVDRGGGYLTLCEAGVLGTRILRLDTEPEYVLPYLELAHGDLLDVQWVTLVLPNPAYDWNHTSNAEENCTTARVKLPIYGNSTTLRLLGNANLTVTFAPAADGSFCSAPEMDFDLIAERVIPTCDLGPNGTDFNDTAAVEACNPYGLPLGDNSYGAPLFADIEYYSTPLRPELLYGPLEDGGFATEHKRYWGTHVNNWTSCRNVSATLTVLEYQEIDSYSWTEYVNCTSYTGIRGHYVDRHTIEASSFGQDLCVARCDPLSPHYNASRNGTCIAYDPLTMGLFADVDPPVFADEKRSLTRSCIGPGCKDTPDRFPGVVQLFGAALCLPEEACRQACLELDECNGIDMHNSLPLCYLTLRASAGSGCIYPMPAHPDASNLVPSPRAADSAGLAFTNYERDVTAFPSASNNYNHYPTRYSLAPIQQIQLEETARWSSDEPPRVLGYELHEHTCVSKCVAQPCFGPHCYCAGVETQDHDSSGDGALCLPLDLCFAACEQIATCKGVTKKYGQPRCILASEDGSDSFVLQDYDHDFFERRNGLACTDIADFRPLYSTITVTNRCTSGAATGSLARARDGRTAATTPWRKTSTTSRSRSRSPAVGWTGAGTA